MRQKIKQIIANAVGVEVADISDETLLYENLGLEAADVSEILEEIELTFDINVMNKDVSELITVEDLLELISQYFPEEL